jgi:dienelactone hydrolase
LYAAISSSKEVYIMRSLSCLFVIALPPMVVHGLEARDFNDYPPHVIQYLTRINTVDQQRYAFRPDYPGGHVKWQHEARMELVRLLAVEKIAAQTKGFEVRVEFGAAEELDGYTRQTGFIETEPGVRIPFYLLKPKGDGPFPLGIFPHGHDTRGHHTTAGVAQDEAHQKKIIEGERDVAVQAVKRGYIAIAPATRGLATDGVPDLYKRHGERDCRSHIIHCLLAGRTAMGERVWDMQRILDWAMALPDVNPKQVLMMGNSGGGMVTLYTAAVDTRITVAVPSCSFTMAASEAGFIYHCDCNLVPGLLEFGNLPDVAGLIAPRALLAVNGRKDTLHSAVDIERAAARVQAIYQAADAEDRFEHRWGQEGHRFYSALMWPFITAIESS